MKSPNLTQWSGPATVLGGVALVLQLALSSALGSAYDASDAISSPILYAIYNLLFQSALLLFVVGLLGLHDRQAERSGGLGRASLYLAMSAGALAAAGLAVALLSDTLEKIVYSTYLGLRGNDLLHVLVTVPVAA